MLGHQEMIDVALCFLCYYEVELVALTKTCNG